MAKIAQCEPGFSLYAVGYASVFIYTSASLSTSTCSTHTDLVCSVHGHVACVTHSTTTKAEEEAAHQRSIIAMTAANKYQIIKSLFKTTEKETTTEQEKMAFFQSPQGFVPCTNNIVPITLFVPVTARVVAAQEW